MPSARLYRPSAHDHPMTMSFRSDKGGNVFVGERLASGSLVERVWVPDAASCQGLGFGDRGSYFIEIVTRRAYISLACCSWVRSIFPSLVFTTWNPGTQNQFNDNTASASASHQRCEISDPVTHSLATAVDISVVDVLVVGIIQFAATAVDDSLSSCQQQTESSMLICQLRKTTKQTKKS